MRSNRGKTAVGFDKSRGLFEMGTYYTTRNEQSTEKKTPQVVMTNTLKELVVP